MAHVPTNFSITHIGLNQEIELKQSMEFVFIPAAGKPFTFQEDDGSVYMDNKERTEVTFKQDFYICKYLCTQEFWEAILQQDNPSGLNTQPSDWKGSTHPVEQISWFDVQEFIQVLNNLITEGKVKLEEKLTGQFRLPSEVQWEYAARSGVANDNYLFAGSHRLDDVGWYDLNSLEHTMPVGLKQANALGLYDMSGNVWEWCGNDYDTIILDGESGKNKQDAYKSMRGGSYWGGAFHCRFRDRDRSHPDNRRNRIGFRLLFFPSSSPAAG